MQSEPQEGPTAKSVEQTKLEHKYEVLKNGDVKVIQEQVQEFIWGGRDFLSLFRGNEKLLEQTRDLMGEEHLKKLQKQEDNLVKEIKKLQPIIKESEEKTAIAYEKMIRKGLADNLKKAVNDKELNENWWVNIWSRAKPERKKQAKATLSAEDQKKYVKIMHKLKRKGLSK